MVSVDTVEKFFNALQQNASLDNLVNRAREQEVTEMYSQEEIAGIYQRQYKMVYQICIDARHLCGSGGDRH